MDKWIGIDWGTSAMRGWLVGPDGAIHERFASDRGMGTLGPADFDPHLRSIVAPYLADGPIDIVVCGMAGAKQGWAEAPYVPVPCAPPGLAKAVTAPGGLGARILPGVRQARPADVMRGEETQIAGVIAADPEFDGVVCLPGTHTKWAHVSAGEIVSFRTFMTGELFALLANRSVLRHSVGEGWDDSAFAEAIGDAMSRPEALAAALFSLRAESLLTDLSPSAARARLSGLLIGAELAAARPYWLGRDVILVGSPALTANYAAALSTQGLAARVTDAEAVTLVGLMAARKSAGASPSSG